MESTQTEESTFNKKPLVAVMLVGAFIAILNQTLLTTALPHLMVDLQINENKAQWVTTIFMLVNGIMIPISAFLIEKFRTRFLFLTAMSLFGIGTLICALAPSFAVLMGGRVIQAAGAGIMMPLMQTVFLLIFPVEKRGAAMGMVGLVISFAPAIGPTLSGWLVEMFPWTILFWILIPVVVVDIIAAIFVIRNVTELRSPKLDLLSIILSTLGFGGLLFGFSNAGQASWTSPLVFIPLAIGICALVMFIKRQLLLEHPILEFRVFKYPLFTLTTGIGMLVFVSLVGPATILPLFIQNMQGHSALETGLTILPGAVLMGLMSPITGRIFDRIGARSLSIIGIALLVVTSLLYTNLSESTSLVYLTVVYAVRMLGLSLVMMPVTTAGLNVLPRELIPHGTAMNNTMRQVTGSIGTAILVTIMTASASLHTNEAMIQGVNNAFIVATVLSFIGLLLSFFIKKPAAV
ncbi:MDR family MFS transporter [Shouchella clausii]|uniref:Efflux transporter multidrug resistance protein n=3 Tax=Shouchella TaxID=2893057 RepID=Q5WH33_SHOC1|nr:MULTISPECIES: MDR family MFS transporter [Shouchella]MCM3312560.1 DHA2 family efflux MFS transporter permease subunit [Psychrobacillus sp. MER TA 17]ALA51036.1 Multidrug and toxin extrusion (MATE) family efflux pump YdhE/NorM [Shouchella clausii]KKI85649.1 multidrug MFS transporter [Shouchella clausii]MBU3231834.1 DHA2 family efflux MFS transporter permease subunit [Shouchella clausii]MBU3264882.1 DHA2 family efflux MFS transporter permease subunit [Shouchella clausii]